MSLRETRYQASQYGFCDRFPTRDAINPPGLPCALFINSIEEFRGFSSHENSIQICFFVHGSDPCMSSVLQVLLPLATQQRKLVVVDIDKVPQLALEYGITKPMIMKLFKMRVVQLFDQDLASSSDLTRFATVNHSVRWRSGEIK